MIKNSSKSKHRKHFLSVRAAQMPLVENKIIEQVRNTLKSLIKRGGLKGYLGIYWPLPGEVDLRPPALRIKLPLALPSAGKDGQLTYHPWTSKPLRKDTCKIPAPLKEPALEPESISLLLVPALAIDKNGVRLGYGGGFFDRLRGQAAWRSVPAIGILPKACISAEPLPKEKWDIPLDGWISELGLTKSSQPTEDSAS